MFPDPAPSNRANQRFGNTETCGGLRVRSNVFSHLAGLLVSKLWLWICSADKHWERRMASFLYRVLSIIFWCSDEQMIWSYASGIIAMMTDKHAIWNWPIMYFPGEPVREFQREMARFR